MLIAPLNWGLGHATRCIPIINYLLSTGCQVVIAGNGASGRVLKQEFPQLEYVELPQFTMKYSRFSLLVKWKILFSLPNLLININKEHRFLRQFLLENKIDAIISDNRFGFWHPTIPSVFITHQLQIISPFGAISTRVLERIQRNWLKRFTECWVPDFEGTPNLSGELSHPKKLPGIPVRYLGPLSRFEPITSSAEIDCLIVLSGPEPQRTLLENMLIKEAVSLPMKIVLVRGLPSGVQPLKTSGNMVVYDYAPTEQLNDLVNKAAFIVARSGYTTVMDLLKLRKKTVLIPTPGQTEQEYLARHLSNEKLACCFTQQEFSFAEALEKAASFPYEFPFSAEDMENYKNHLQSFMQSIRKA